MKLAERLCERIDVVVPLQQAANRGGSEVRGELCLWRSRLGKCERIQITFAHVRLCEGEGERGGVVEGR